MHRCAAYFRLFCPERPLSATLVWRDVTCNRWWWWGWGGWRSFTRATHTGACTRRRREEGGVGGWEERRALHLRESWQKVGNLFIGACNYYSIEYLLSWAFYRSHRPLVGGGRCSEVCKLLVTRELRTALCGIFSALPALLGRRRHLLAPGMSRAPDWSVGRSLSLAASIHTPPSPGTPFSDWRAFFPFRSAHFAGPRS